MVRLTEWIVDQVIGFKKSRFYRGNKELFDLPIPTYPETLRGEMWGVTCHFNPAGYLARVQNFEIFAKKVREQGLKLLAVELVFSGSKREIDPDLCDHILYIEAEHVLWQKERLLNIGISKLPDSCDKVVWLDADVIFENENWVAQTCRNLEIFNVVQPYQKAYWLSQGTQTPLVRFPSYGNREGQQMPGAACNLAHGENLRSSRYTSIGHCGFAWAIRKRLLDKCGGLYDRQILGGADVNITRAMYGAFDFLASRGDYRCEMTIAMKEDYLRWGGQFFLQVMASVGFTEGRILHLWHGTRGDRIKLHKQRQAKLLQFGFDPAKYLVLDENECWSWNNADPNLTAWAEQYFIERNEGPRNVT